MGQQRLIVFRGACQPIDRFADRPISSGRDDRRKTLPGSLFSQLDDMARVFRDSQFEIHAGSFEGGFGFRPALLCIPAIGIWVEDDFCGHVALILPFLTCTSTTAARIKIHPAI